MSDDIKVTDGTVLESLNNKVDLDGGNYVGSPLEEYIHEHCGGAGAIGQPQFTLDNVLPNNCIWLEGATVSRTTYAELFAVYGTTYGKGDGSTTFALPNFLNRAVWGSNDFGYLSAGLPNITGAFGTMWGRNSTRSGALYQYSSTSDKIGGSTSASYFTIGLDASKSNSIYGNSDTVQPPAIKVRVYTKYK